MLKQVALRSNASWWYVRRVGPVRKVLLPLAALRLRTKYYVHKMSKLLAKQCKISTTLSTLSVWMKN